MTAPIPSNSSIDKAAETLLGGAESFSDREHAQSLVNQWRASFSLPLRAVFKQMSAFTHQVDPRVICSRRLKRMESIIAKLQRPEMRRMKLSRMQDIGGCRAIFPDVRSLDSFRQKREQAIKDSAFFVDSSDYIAPPKQDGYRGIHLIVHPGFRNPKYQQWNTRRIEIQIRTVLQHAWATTVESVDMFHGENIKIGAGDLKWRRFFALCSTVFAKEERAPIVPGTPDDAKVLAAEICELVEELDPFRTMEGWKTALTAIDRVASSTTQTIALVTVDIEKMSVGLRTFSNDEVEVANLCYALIEEEIRQGRPAHTFLVAVDRMRDLKVAYPNLYADTQVFNYQILKFLRIQGQ